MGSDAQGLQAWNHLMAGAVLALLPPLLVLIALRKPLLETMGIE
jgi:sn-glycerol 3-phosphate transport system permease protein